MLQGDAGVGDDADLGQVGLADLARVQIDMDQLAGQAKDTPLAWDEADQSVKRQPTEITTSAEAVIWLPQVVPVWPTAPMNSALSSAMAPLAVPGDRDGGAQPFGQRGQRVRGIGRDRAAAGDDDRAARGQQQFGRRLDRGRVGMGDAQRQARAQFSG